MTTRDTGEDTGRQAHDRQHVSRNRSHRLSIDTILELLAHRYRRDLLGYLYDRPERTQTIEELTEHVLERETGMRNEQRSREAVELQLRHIHVPKLAEAGLLEYDDRDQRVRYYGNEPFEQWLERIRDAARE